MNYIILLCVLERDVRYTTSYYKQTDHIHFSG